MPVTGKEKIVARLVADNQVFTGHNEKAILMDQFYSNLLGVSIDRDCSVNLEAVGVPTFDLAALDLPFLEKEVWETVKLLLQIRLRVLMVSQVDFIRPAGL